MYQFLKPKTIRSGAAIRLHGKRNAPISSAKYVHYLKNLINDLKSTYPQYDGLSDLQILANLQHKGGASCLVDFSNNFLISLWFATYADENDFGYMYCYNINGDSFEKGNLSFVTDKHVESNIEDIILDTRKTSNYVKEHSYKFWVWKPAKYNSRITRQDSYFVFGMEPFMIEEHPIFTIPILPSWKKQIQSALKAFFGMTAESIYPDPDGFATSHSKASNLPALSDYINPTFLNGRFKGSEELQYGLSCLTKGQYKFSIMYLENFLTINDRKLNLKNLEKGSFETIMIGVELYYSLAYCYLKTSQLDKALINFEKSYSLLRCLPSFYPIIELAEYVDNKYYKVMNDYIQLCYELEDFCKVKELCCRLLEFNLEGKNSKVLPYVIIEADILGCFKEHLFTDEYHNRIFKKPLIDGIYGPIADFYKLLWSMSVNKQNGKELSNTDLTAAYNKLVKSFYDEVKDERSKEEIKNKCPLNFNLKRVKRAYTSFWGIHDVHTDILNELSNKIEMLIARLNNAHEL